VRICHTGDGQCTEHHKACGTTAPSENEKNNKTEAKFPTLSNPVETAIAVPQVHRQIASTYAGLLSEDMTN
jgi:hypothetical protein